MLPIDDEPPPAGGLLAGGGVGGRVAGSTGVAPFEGFVLLGLVVLDDAPGELDGLAVLSASLYALSLMRPFRQSSHAF